MKIWKLKVPLATPYAELNCLYEKHPVSRCGACGAATAAPTLPIDVEWDDGSDLLGDFVHAGAKIVTRRTIGETLRTRFGGIALGEVAMPDHPNLRRPKRVTKRTPRRIWLPYEGPELCYLDPVDVDLDPSSTVEIDKRCEQCGTIRYRKLNGVEVKTLASHTPREPERGLFVTS